MPTPTAPRLTPRRRFNRGLAHTATGPVDLTRGAVGLAVASARAGTVRLRRRCRAGSPVAAGGSGVGEFIADEVRAARTVVAGLPAVLQETRRSPERRRRLKVVAGVAALLLAVGAGVTVLVRRAGPPQEAPARPPSVDVQTQR